jgi:signal transduction histidine kinase
VAGDFPTTPRTPLQVRAVAIAIALVAGALATRTTLTSIAWIGSPFPGFVMLDNGLVAAIGLPHWSGTRVPDLYWRQITSAGGVAVRSGRDVYDRAAREPLGTPVRYTLRIGSDERQIVVPTQRFAVADWLLLHLPYLSSGAAFLTSGLIAWVFRPRSPLAGALLALGVTWGTMMFATMDLYGPARFFRLYAVAETFMPVVMLQLVLLFPQPHPWARWRLLGLVPALCVLPWYQRVLYAAPASVRHILYFNLLALTATGIVFGARLVAEYLTSHSPLARQRVRVVTLGVLFAFALPAAMATASAWLGGGMGMNFATVTTPLFGVSLAYAIVKHDLLEIDAMVKRGAYYLVLTGTVGAGYVAAVVVFNSLLSIGPVTSSPWFPTAFALGVLALLNPLRSRLQAFVDRLFFRTEYDAPRLLASAGERLAASLDPGGISERIREAVEAAIPNHGTRLFVRDAGAHLVELGSGQVLPPTVSAVVGSGRLATAFDPVERYRDAAEHERMRSALVSLGAELAIPLLLQDALTGVLTVGRKCSGRFYTAGDGEFLHALAQQAAIALESARRYAALSALNLQLESRVEERTTALRAANDQLTTAYTDLKSTEAQLVQSEKMASLGRLVAGVAHEINDPVSFLVANVGPLRRRLEQAAAGCGPSGRALLAEAGELTAIMARGAERTAAIVRDLRSFSRVAELRTERFDLHESLDTTIRLLAPRWRERITIERDYASLPPVEGDPGQLAQVFTNLIANACDAIPGQGTIHVTTARSGDTVTVNIRDDGIGIPPEAIPHLFDPFYTTKDVGHGTGLGLAITQSVVTAHGGYIAVRSVPGQGTVFEVTLPIAAGPALAPPRAHESP